MIWFSGDTERPLLKDFVEQTNFSKIKFNEVSMKFENNMCYKIIDEKKKI